jgi:hypothetical protein
MNIKQPVARTNLSFSPFLQADEVDVRGKTYSIITKKPNLYFSDEYSYTLSSNMECHSSMVC